MQMGLHWPELVGLIAVALLIFGPKRLPEMGSSIGKTIREFQHSMKSVTSSTERTSAPTQVPEAQTPSGALPAPDTSEMRESASTGSAAGSMSI